MDNQIRVDMTPNPLDLKTLHCSQGDTEAREWEFELHNNGELIDTSEVTEQLFFKAYKGGTEQLLPENTSTPTTSPFIGDIRYPQGLLTDQEFTYRQSPTEEDGLAKITDIKGNTLVWNQLVQNGNFANGTTDWYGMDATISASNGVCRVTFTGNSWNNDLRQTLNIMSGHKYLFSCDYKMSSNFGFCHFGVYDSNAFLLNLLNSTTKTHFTSIFTAQSSTNTVRFTTHGDVSAYSGEYYEVSNVYLIDLTQMGLDITEPSEFTSLFPLSYYAYNQGSLLSFNGNGIKTVGKNLNPWTGVDYIASTSRTVFLKKGDYVFSTDNGNNFEGSTQIYICLADSNGNNITSGGITSGYLSLNDSGTFYYGGYGRNNIPFTLNFDALVSFGFNNQRPANINEIQLEFGSTPSDYEPYTSTTTDLPISTYFPTGMKSAGNVYDELTPRKAVTRVGAVDLGSLTWTYASDAGHLRFVSSTISPDAKMPANNTIANAVCTKYGIVTEGNVYNNQKVGLCIISNSRAMVYDPNYTDATAFKTAMSGVYLYYELATPIETSFTTASLVTENAEIPLSNNDGVLLGKCTEQLSENPGFIDAKIKLSDSDGDVYSNKIQIHVERSPQ